MDADTFRAVARSSPWLWTSVALTHRLVDGASSYDETKAWIRRPGRMRVEQVGRPPVLVDESHDPGAGRGFLVALSDPDAQTWEPPTTRFPQDPAAPQPERRPDGLVAARPTSFEITYDDPMHVNYRWVAMLDPVELADGSDDDGPSPRRMPVEILELAETERRGRSTLDAVVVPNHTYDPRCACCPLLYSAITDAYEDIPAQVIKRRRYADAYRIQLDRATGICVGMRELGGEQDGEGFEVTLHQVDAPYPDALFV